MFQNRPKIVPRRVGLDIGSHTVNGVEIVERGTDIVVRSAGSVPIHESKGAFDYGHIVQAIKNLWSTARFESNQVVMALPADALYIKWLNLEAPDREMLDQTARVAAARGAPFTPENAIIDYRVLSSRGMLSPNVHFVMLVAASALAVNKLLNAAESAGLEPIAVDIDSAAALRSFNIQKRSGGHLWSGQPLAHCIIGATNTTIAVIRGSEMEFARTVSVGGNDFTNCIAEFGSLSWGEAEQIKITPGNRLVEGGSLIASINNEEVRIPCENVVGRLAREIQRSLRFFSSQFAEGSYLGMIGSATISGGGALMKGLDACLQLHGIEIAGITNPFNGLSVDAEAGVQRIGDTTAQYSTAVGLAIGDYRSTPNIIPVEGAIAA